MTAYHLDMAAIRHYVTAVQALERDSATDAKLNAELEAMSGEPDATLDQLRAKMARHPRVLAYYRHEGLSPEDAVLLPLATTNAVTASDPNASAEQKSLASREQTEFARANHDELIQLMDWGEGED